MEPANVAMGMEVQEEPWHAAMDSLRQAVKKIHANAVYLHGPDQKHADELRVAAHNIVQAVLLLTGERVPQTPEEEALYTECPVCGAQPGQNCIPEPGHRVHDHFHDERVAVAREHLFQFLAQRRKAVAASGQDSSAEHGPAED